MNKFILVLFAISATTIFGQQVACPANALATNYNINLLSQSIEGSSFTACSSLLGAQTCCSADTINGFQNKTQDILAQLTAVASARDTFFVSARAAVFSISDTVTRFSVATDDALGNLENPPEEEEEESPGEEENPEEEENAEEEEQVEEEEEQEEQEEQEENGSGRFLQSQEDLNEVIRISELIQGWSQGIVNNFDEFRDNFTTYQNQRSTCVTNVVTKVASAFCLACAPDANNFLDANGHIVVDPSVTDDINSACAPYVSLAAQQSNWLNLYYVRNILADLADALEAVASGNVATGTQDFLTTVNGFDQETSAPDDDTPVQMPTDCNAQTCNWFIINVWNGGDVNFDLLAAGGPLDIVEIKDNTTRILFDRELQSSWQPSAGDVNYDINFQDNPAGVSNDLSGLRAGLVGLSLAVLGFLFF